MKETLSSQFTSILDTFPALTEKLKSEKKSEVLSESTEALTRSLLSQTPRAKTISTWLSA